ncbi:MFS transporter [Candidatus Rhodobacter oscarellae]|nr:MFS transporter [Candidatus Rhodobacter lobularis]
MSILTAAKLSRAPAAGLAAVGVLWGGLAASMPDIKARVGASDAELGLSLLFSAAGGVIAMWFAPRVGAALGRFAMPVMCLLVAAAFYVPLLAWDFLTLGAAMFVVGLAVAGLDILTNVEISARETRHGQHLMGFNHAMFSFAFAGAAYGTSLARQAGAGPDEILPILSVVCVGLAAMSYLPQVAQDAQQDTGQAARPPWAAVILTGVILMASFIGENSTEAWSALHIERTLGAPAGEGGLGPAVLGLVMGIGRLFGQVISERIGHGRLIFGSGVLGVIGALMIAGAGSAEMVIVGVSVSAVGMAVIVPSAMSILGARVGEKERALALSRAWMLGIVGFFIGPALMGGISELFGLRVSFVAIACVVAVILPAIWALEGRRARA